MSALDATPNDNAGAAAGASDDPLFTRVRDCYRQARDHRHDWRKETELSFAYVACDQWDEEALEQLREQERPAITFNRIGPFVDGVAGLEISNRQEIRYIPRTIESSGVTDLLTDVAKWARDNCDAEDEESTAFRDAVICGEGWTGTGMDYDTDPQGVIDIDHVDPLEMFPDPSSTKANYADARWLIRVRDVSPEKAMEMAPDADEEDLNAAWADDVATEADDPHNAREAPFYRNDQGGEFDRNRKRVRLVEFEWFETERGHKVLLPDGTVQHMGKADHARLQAGAKAMGAPPMPSTPVTLRRYHRALVGRKVLVEMDGAERGGFSYKAITAKRDRNKRMWYGLVRPMRDPQDWSNKWLSQQLHIINTNAKGGVMVETDAVEDMRDFEDSWARSDSVTELMPGALSRGAVAPKPQSPIPAALQQMAEFAMNAIPQVTGFSPEMMGMTDRTQPGVVEMQRKQQGMAILADLFNALRRYRKEQGRLLLWFIQEFISDGRIIRIGGQEDGQYVRLIRDQTLGEYDVVVDDTPSSPNMKERTWTALMQLSPLLAKMNLPPQMMIEMFEYSPLPATLVNKLRTMLQQMPPGGQNPLEQAKAQGEQARAQERQANAAKMQAEVQQLPQRLALDQQEQQASVELKRAQAAFALAQAQASGDDQRTQAAIASVNALLDGQAAGAALAGQRHDQAMDLVQAHHAARDQAHGMNMDKIAAQQQAQQMQAQAEQAAQQAQAQPNG